MATLGAAVSCFSPWRPSKDLSFLQGLVLTPDITGQRSRAAAWSDGIPVSPDEGQPCCSSSRWAEHASLQPYALCTRS